MSRSFSLAVLILQLHNSDYDHDKALEVLVKCPIPPRVDKKWTEDENVSIMSSQLTRVFTDFRS